jgi:hypothetical protein
MDMRNARSLQRAGFLVTVANELAKYWLDLMGVQEVRWEGGGTAPAGEYTFLYGKGNENAGFFLCIRESYQQLSGLSFSVIGCHVVLRGCWCLNVHAPTEEKTDNVKYSFYEELERVFYKFPKCHTKFC